MQLVQYRTDAVFFSTSKCVQCDNLFVFVTSIIKIVLIFLCAKVIIFIVIHGSGG